MNRQELAIRLLEHLQGKHNQKSHGNRYGSAAAIRANVARLGGDKAALKSMATKTRKDTTFQASVKAVADKKKTDRAFDRLNNYKNPGNFTPAAVANMKKYRQLKQGTPVIVALNDGYKTGKILYGYDSKGVKEVRVKIDGSKSRPGEYHPDAVEPVNPRLSWRR
jgi:hypothetical protein